MTQEGKVALLVAAGDAIGAAVATKFATNGYKVCIARRDASKSQELVDKLKAQGCDVRAYSVDARKEAEVQELFAKVEAEVGPIDVTLYNGGANVQRPLLDTTEHFFFRSWELACYAGFLVGKEAAKYMVKRQRGTMLFTGATGSIRGGAGFAAFSAAKMGLRGAVQAMARELAPHNIHVMHLIIDASVDSAEIHRRMRVDLGIDASTLPTDSLTKTSSIADAYWYVVQQPRDAWTHEMDLRPAIEKW